MTTHELAEKLFSYPPMQVGTHANNHTAYGTNINVALFDTYLGDVVIIGNFVKSSFDVGHGNEKYVKQL